MCPGSDLTSDNTLVANWTRKGGGYGASAHREAARWVCTYTYTYTYIYIYIYIHIS